MEDLIADYEETRTAMLGRIVFLKRQLRKESLMTIQRERLKARLKLLIAERYELLDAINAMRRRY